MENNLISQLLKQVKQNKKYSTISDEIILEEINHYLKKNNLEKMQRITKEDVSEIRKSLHRLYSSYLSGKKSKRQKYFREFRNNPDNLDIIRKILSTAVSAKERFEDYETIYKKIFEITKIPETIVDIGCGLNPLSYQYMNLEKLNYYCYDIDKEDIDFLNEYFSVMKNKGLNGKAQILNAKNANQIISLPYSDIVFLWKLIDLINEKNSKPGEELIKSMIKKTKFLVISFATRTISGVSMNIPRRKGFELMIDRLNLKFHSFKTNNEIFYVIEKN